MTKLERFASAFFLSGLLFLACLLVLLLFRVSYGGVMLAGTIVAMSLVIVGMILALIAHTRRSSNNRESGRGDTIIEILLNLIFFIP